MFIIVATVRFDMDYSLVVDDLMIATDIYIHCFYWKKPGLSGLFHQILQGLSCILPGSTYFNAFCIPYHPEIPYTAGVKKRSVPLKIIQLRTKTVSFSAGHQQKEYQ